MGEIIIRIVTVAIRAASPELRKVLVNVFTSLRQAAAATENQFDDILVEILGALLDIGE